MLGVDYFTSTPWAFAAFVFFVLLLAQSEFYRLLAPRSNYPLRFIGLPLGAFFLAFAFMGPYSTALLSGPGSAVLARWLGEEIHWQQLCNLTLAASVIAPMIYYLLTWKKKHALESCIGVTFGLVYVAVLGSYMFKIRFQFQSQAIWYALLFVFTAKSNDIGAYLIGSTLGRHKLHPVSPRKTLEGSIGGIALGTVVAILVTHLLASESFAMPVHLAAVYGVVVCASSQLGDLAESMLKRNYGAKDSGNLIPGSGGILDFADCLLFSAPVAYYFVEFAIR